MSEIWETYSNRVTVKGRNVREDTLVREKARLTHMLRDSLSFHVVSMYEDSIIETHTNCRGELVDNSTKRRVAIINSDNLDEKYVYSFPDEDIQPGDLFYWADNYWLITDRDANNEVYTRAKAIQCNYLLKWVHVEDGNPVVKEQWCYIEDGTKYMTGELEDRHFIMTRGDARIAMTIARNKYTVKFKRKSRFLIDDADAEYYLAYDLSKPLKVGHVYNGKGVFKYVLSESDPVPDIDNMELGIADYYNFFQKNSSEEDPGEDDTPGDNTPPGNGKKVWL